MTFWNISRNNSLSIGGSRYVREPPNNLFLFLHFLNFFQWKLCGRWYLFQSRIYRIFDITISLQTIHILFLPYESSIYYFKINRYGFHCWGTATLVFRRFVPIASTNQGLYGIPIYLQSFHEVYVIYMMVVIYPHWLISLLLFQWELDLDHVLLLFKETF